MPQRPAVQNAAPFAGVGQAMPQPPQAAMSVWVLRHEPLQFCVPAWQLAAQAPLAQTCPAPQAVPHAPQFAVSVCVSRQVPAQFVSPAPQETTHIPPVHT